MAKLIDLRVDGIITDYPDRLRRVMAAKGMPLPPPFLQGRLRTEQSLTGRSRPRPWAA
jgi:hypothetical protein